MPRQIVKTLSARDSYVPDFASGNSETSRLNF